MFFFVFIFVFGACFCFDVIGNNIVHLYKFFDHPQQDFNRRSPPDDELLRQVVPLSAAGTEVSHRFQQNAHSVGAEVNGFPIVGQAGGRLYPAAESVVKDKEAGGGWIACICVCCCCYCAFVLRIEGMVVKPKILVPMPHQSSFSDHRGRLRRLLGLLMWWLERGHHDVVARDRGESRHRKGR